MERAEGDDTEQAEEPDLQGPGPYLKRDAYNPKRHTKLGWAMSENV